MMRLAVRSGMSSGRSDHMLTIKQRGEVISILRAMTRLNHEQQSLLQRILNESSTTPKDELIKIVLTG
jgi:hypothetical protein